MPRAESAIGTGLIDAALHGRGCTEDLILPPLPLTSVPVPGDL